MATDLYSPEGDSTFLLVVVMENSRSQNRRLWIVLSLYAILAVIAILFLDDRFFRGVMLGFLVILAIKTLMHANDEKME
jgi:predicted branched-subunit amino acid permease